MTQGDLSQQITVEAEGEVAELKGNLNQMIDNLRETTRANEDQDWLKTNLAQFTGHMQGGRDLLDVTQLIVSELTPLVGPSQGSFFVGETSADGDDRRCAGSRRTATDGARTCPSTFAARRGARRPGGHRDGRRSLVGRRAARLHPDHVGARRGDTG